MSESQFPALADLIAKSHVITLPLNTKFRGLTERELVLIEGTAGWTEWSPFSEYNDAEAAVWLAAAIEFGFGKIPSPLRNEIPINATLPAINDRAEIERVLAR
ncbi:MAG: O-succinylbenzoate synthase, partial [Rhodoluna sp.]